jgi:hypothetical protein
MLANAVSGSSKNITPNWLIAASKGAPSDRVPLRIGHQKGDVHDPLLERAVTRELDEGSGDIGPHDRTPRAYEMAGRDRRGPAPTADVEDLLALAEAEAQCSSFQRRRSAAFVSTSLAIAPPHAAPDDDQPEQPIGSGGLAPPLPDDGQATATV